MLKSKLFYALIVALGSTSVNAEINSPIMHNAQKDVVIGENINISGDATLFTVLGGAEVSVQHSNDGFVKLSNTNNGGPALLLIGSSLSIETGEFSIISRNGGYGIAHQGGKDNNGGSLSVNAKTITIDALGSGMAINAGQYGGQFSLQASEKISLGGTIGFRANNANINQGSMTFDAPLIDIEGNIYTTGTNSITIGNSELTSTINLNGSVHDESTGDSGITINMDGNSVWNITGDSNVKTLSGLGQIRLGTTIDNGAITTHTLDIESISESESLNLGFNGITADNIETVDDILVLAQGITLNSEELSSYTATVDEGKIQGAIEVEKDGDEVKVHVAPNLKLSSLNGIHATSLLQWRHEMNDLTKRMGELRTSPEGIGAWARLYGSEQEYGAHSLETKNASVQVGADFDIGSSWKVGGAFSYTDSTSTMNNGDADGDMYGLALYGTWFNGSGQFVDLIAKYSRLSNDFRVDEMAGDYDNNAFSLSAEYGWHLKLNDISFVEPQVEITYGRILGDDFTTSNGVKVQQDDTDSLIGRVGLRGGFYFPDNRGTLYGRISALHDFKGETGFLASTSATHDYFSEDLGDTWCEFGVGANFKLTDATYTYVDLEKSTGGDVKENWRWNVGLRTVF